MRLIFHLSHPRSKPGLSVNSNIPSDLCSVKYPDFTDAVKLCLKAGRSCKMSKSDMSTAFRNLGILREHWKYLIMQCKSPLDGKIYFFIDKCLAFGSSISCKHFQDFSDSIAHIVHHRSNAPEKPLVNYLDDYIFIAFLSAVCNGLMKIFLEVCSMINFPVSKEKTVWATTKLVFLGMLLDSEEQTILVPVEKIERARQLIREGLSKKSRKITLLNLQKLCGFLNFMCRCIVLGRAFTRHLYPTGTNKLKAHHHLKITEEMRLDMEMWLKFLQNPAVYCRPFADFDVTLVAEDIKFFTDASMTVGFGGFCNRSWFGQTWCKEFIESFKPNISLLELYALAVGVKLWIHRFKNSRVVLYCDNLSVCHMVNQSSSKCKHCMKLIRLITLETMIHNVRIYVKHVRTECNEIADFLSRGKICEFKDKFAGEFNKNPTQIYGVIPPLQELL